MSQETDTKRTGDGHKEECNKEINKLNLTFLERKVTKEPAGGRVKNRKEKI